MRISDGSDYRDYEKSLLKQRKKAQKDNDHELEKMTNEALRELYKNKAKQVTMTDKQNSTLIYDLLLAAVVMAGIFFFGTLLFDKYNALVAFGILTIGVLLFLILIAFILTTNNMMKESNFMKMIELILSKIPAINASSSKDDEK